MEGNTEGLKQLSGGYDKAIGLACLALAAFAGLSVLANLAGPSWEVVKGIANVGNSVIAQSGQTVLGALAVLGLLKYLKS